MSVQPTFPGFGPSCVRPLISSDSIVYKAMERLFYEKIRNWLLAGGSTEKDVNADTQNCIRDLVKHYDRDGYRFAKSLDGDGWDCDADLVERLDSCSYFLHSEHKKAVELWYSSNHFELYPTGTKVKVVSGKRRDLKDKPLVIVNVDYRTAEYVCCLAENYTPTNRSGYVVNHEDVQPYE